MIRRLPRASVFAAIAFAGMTMMPAAAWATAPGAITFDAVSTGSTTATVNGEVNPEGVDTSFVVQYDVASSTWCTSGGTSGVPAHTIPGWDVGFDSDFHPVWVDLTGLTAGSAYCAQLVAMNGTPADTDGGQVDWTQGAPTADTFDAVSNDQDHAHVNGEVNQAGQTTTYEAEYDQAISTWCTSGGTSGSPADSTAPATSGLPDPADGTFHPLSVELSGLTEGVTYCAELVASNAEGPGASLQVEWTQGTPTVDTTAASPTGIASASISGEIDPIGRSTTYWAQYALADSAWCTSGGTSGSPTSTAPADLDFTGFAFEAVSIDLTELTPGASYCGEISAENQNGTGHGDQLTWTQPTPPPPVTLAVSVTGGGSGTVTSAPTGIVCGSGGSACSKAFAPGTQVTLTAKANAGSVFLGWLRVGPPGVVPPCSGNSPTCTFTLTSGQTVTAAFEQLPTSGVTVRLAGTGSGTVTSSPAGISCGSGCSGQFSVASQVTLTATAAPGSKFTGWSYPSCPGTDPCPVQPVLGGSVTVIATFDLLPPPPPPTPPSCKVPKVKGKKLAAAKTAIRHAHCGVGKITKAFSTKVKKGRVISTKPRAGSKHPRGTKVKLTVSKGRKP